MTTPRDEVVEGLEKIETIIKDVQMKLDTVGNGMAIHKIRNAMQELEHVKLLAQSAAASCKACKRGSPA